MSTAPKPIALPVTAVTCLEDRAHVERAAVLDLEAGSSGCVSGRSVRWPSTGPSMPS